MKYRCLVFDHDDTTVNSTANVHYPCFREFMAERRPDLHITLNDYVTYNFDPGVIAFFRDICGLDEEGMRQETEYWVEYASRHVSEAFAGIREIMERQKAEGVITAVISHSYAHNILRDYEHNQLPLPDEIFGWEQPPEERKPSPHALYQLMQKYDLQPKDILVIDDLKPGLIMARAAGCDFAAAMWCFDIPENRKYMRENADVFCDSVEDLKLYLEGHITDQSLIC